MNDLWRLPSTGPVPLNARLYPTNTQSTGTTNRHQKFIMSMFSTFFDRTMPP